MQEKISGQVGSWGILSKGYYMFKKKRKLTIMSPRIILQSCNTMPYHNSFLYVELKLKDSFILAQSKTFIEQQLERSLCYTFCR